MENNSLIKIIKTVDDINDIEKVKYINIDIEFGDKDVLKKLTDSKNYCLVSDSIKDRKGYIYTDYETFYHGAKKILKIVDSIPNSLNELEKARYLYINLGKNLGYDINSIPEKNDDFRFEQLGYTNNIFSALTTGKGNNSSICKLYLYLCRLCNIDCEMIIINDYNHLCNKLFIGGKNLIVDLTLDIPMIKSLFKTEHFGMFNEDKEMDIKIKYITKEYNDVLLDKELKKIDYSSVSSVYDILSKCGDIIDMKNIGPIELGIIYDLIFTRYCPNYDIKINNLYYKNNGEKKHFVMVSYGDKHYSYNYNRNMFSEISNEILENGISEDQIGFYLKENIPVLKGNKALT